jgi:hypothetical protein
MESPTISLLISTLALMLSFGSSVLSLRADRRARESVRPYVSTGVHLTPDDMSVSLSNYGAGVAIVTKISMSRGKGESATSLVSLLPSSANYEVQPSIDFVQDQYFLRPGDAFPIAAVKPKAHRKGEDALRDWTKALDGIKIEIHYLDIFGKRFDYVRVFSTTAYV